MYYIITTYFLVSSHLVYCHTSFILMSYIFYMFYMFYMSPALLCKSSIQPGNAEQCTLAFIHLLSSSCTSNFYNISYMSVPIVNASVWWYIQPHSECILSDPSHFIIIIIVCIIHVFIVFVVQLISLYSIM